MMPTGERYTRTAVVLHWLVAAIVVGQFTLGWLMQEIAKQPPGPRAEAFNLHKSIGLTILALMILRSGWRLGHPAPALPPMPRWQRLAAHANHALLYALLIAMPLVGYLGSAVSGYPVHYFGLALPSWAGRHDAVKDAMSVIHLGAAWVLAFAVALHLAAVAKHTWIDRDGLLARMGWRARRASPLTSAAGGE